MRLSQVPFQTLREAPAGVERSGHGFLLRGRFVQVDEEQGGHVWLPWGVALLRRLECLVRATLAEAGAVEVQWVGADPKPSVGSHLEVLLLRDVRSYRQLPAALYAGVDVIRPGGLGTKGLLQAGASRGVGWLSAHASPSGRDQWARAMRARWDDLLLGLKVPVRWATASASVFGPGGAWLALVDDPAGPVEWVECAGCGRRAERSVASADWEPVGAGEPLLEPELVATPGATTIADLAEFLHLPSSRTMKVVFYTVEGRVVCVAVRGDLSVDEAKVARLLGTADFHPSSEQELAQVGAVAGYGSPVGLRGAEVWADVSVARARNLVAGANQPGYHQRNINEGRDFVADRVVDVALVGEGDRCVDCGGRFRLERGAELGRVESLDAGWAAERGMGYLTAGGEEAAPEMAGGILYLDAVVGAMAEACQDEHGLVWPLVCAPFDIYLMVVLGRGAEEVVAEAERLYDLLRAEGWRVLFDDRDARAGVKFNDADLLGVPVRVTVGARSLEAGGAEVKARWEREVRVVPSEALSAHVAALLERT